ncbi:MAG: hypothetical protein JO293_01350 [Candidatus Eremiobacteraeota bacterium]|nr:hypothetical protein [Candidatus Eremiobacteraeota bacterium]
MYQRFYFAAAPVSLVALLLALGHLFVGLGSHDQAQIFAALKEVFLLLLPSVLPLVSELKKRILPTQAS